MKSAYYNNLFLYGGAFSFLLGVCIRSFWIIPVWVIIFLCCLGIVFFVVSLNKHVLASILVLVCIFSLSLGALRFSMKSAKIPNVEIFLSQEGKITLRGRVVSEVEKRETSQRFVLQTEKPDSVKVLVTTDRYPAVYFGENLLIQSSLKTPSNFMTDTGREFDYVSYLAKDSIYFIAPFANVLERSPSDVFSLRRTLFSFKDSFISAFERIIPYPESSLLSGILLGVKESLGDELEQSFIDTGTIHIVVLSGYNVTIVSEAIIRSLQVFIPRTLSFVLGGFGIVLFAIITGATTTTLRASIMGLLGLLARLTGRTYEVSRILLLAAIVMVLHNPFVLVFDISFQLSFIATLGLIWISPIVATWGIARFFTTRFGLREIFASTIATQIAVLPYLLYRIGTVSIISPLANMLVLPVIPLAMGAGAVSGFLELVFGFGSYPIPWFSYGLLHYVIEIVRFLSSFSFSSLVVPAIPFIFILVLYVVIIFWVMSSFRNPRIQKELLKN